MPKKTDISMGKILSAVLCTSAIICLSFLLAGASGTIESSSSLKKPIFEMSPSGRVDAVIFDSAPPRKSTGLVLTRKGFRFPCMDCHKMIPSKWNHDYPLVEHRNLVLKHGNNRYCLNCHHPQNRNVFVDYNGSEIAEEKVTEMCAKCHGPRYRDWKAGAHGRRNGYWNKESGDQIRLTCIQCHDPHSPAYPKLHPESPPTYPRRGAGGKEKSNPSIGH